MPTETPHPETYAERFHCLGSTCEDNCCHGWTVPLDQATYDRYRALPPSPLKVLVDQSVERTAPACGSARNEAAALSEGGLGNGPATGGGVTKAIFAKIRMNAASECPLLTKDHLCRVHQELGAGMLSYTCATYPRIVHSVGGLREAALTLSCPEAARLVLLSPDLTGTWPATATIASAGVPASSASAEELPAHFWAIRATVLRLVHARVYPLWQRMFLLDLLCRRLDLIDAGELTIGVPQFLADFESAASTGSLRANLDTLPQDRNAQLDLVLRLAGLMLKKSSVRPRFVDAVKAFTTGIGNGPGATLESLSARYGQAQERAFRPFAEQHPHVMENFLVNTIVRCQFPFGTDAVKPGASQAAQSNTKAHEFALLAAQFALMRGMLIGVAGFHGAAFSAEHVVHTVQAATKHFEHHPEFLSMAHALLVERNMDGPRGLAILLRDAGMTEAEKQSEIQSGFRAAPAGMPQTPLTWPNRAAAESMPATPAIPVPARQAERSV